MSIDYNLKIGEEVEIIVPNGDQTQPPILACQGVVDFLNAESVWTNDQTPWGPIAYHVCLRSAPNHWPFDQIYYDPATLKCTVIRSSDVRSMTGQIARKT